MNKSELIFTAACLLLGSGSASATVFAVTNAADLSSAVHVAQGGDTIALNGTFGATTIKYHYWTSTVTLDATHATFTDTLALSNLSNLTVVGGAFGSPTASEVYGEAVYVNTVDHVAFVNPTVVGNFLTGGIGIIASTNVAVTGGSFSTVHKAIGLTGVTNAVDRPQHRHGIDRRRLPGRRQPQRQPDVEPVRRRHAAGQRPSRLHPVVERRRQRAGVGHRHQEQLCQRLHAGLHRVRP